MILIVFTFHSLERTSLLAADAQAGPPEAPIGH